MQTNELMMDVHVPKNASGVMAETTGGYGRVQTRQPIGDQAGGSRVAFLRSLRGIERFSQVFGGVRLRTYQEETARAIAQSVLGNRGLSFVVMFPRQSGKNVLQAQLEVYLMVLFAEQGAEMVKLSPTHEPQNLNAMRRLETALEDNFLTRGGWRKQGGNHYRFKKAHITFLSAAKGSNIVGASASTLLELDEAQDIEIAKYDKQIAPMAASSNATRVFFGTAWTGETLLARELRAAKEAEARDGIRRVFRLGAEEVRKEAPAYGLFVDEQSARLGRNHPLVRSQFFSEEINFENGLFGPARLGLMLGSHAAMEGPTEGKRYALLLDVAGEDEASRTENGFALMGEAELANPGRDATALTVVEVDTGLMDGLAMTRPRYKVCQRHVWVGERHSRVLGRVLALAEHWRAEKVVVDASGVGAGLASMLQDRLGERVVSVVFNAAVKSRIGWGFLAVIDSGRFQDFQPGTTSALPGRHANPLAELMLSEQEKLQALFWKQLRAVSAEAGIGPERHLRWSVPEGTRDAEGAHIHDDLVLSAALTAVLDEQDWRVSGEGGVILAVDPLKEMKGGF
ncbi:MAG TPA: hypothetical protein PLN80_00135 [Anaerolineaceae bacterium]|nr:hypothetical protein [Anaerolineaceae bacterium]